MPDIPLPLSVGKDVGRIILEYEDTPENREMARRIAEAIAEREDG